MPLDIWVPRQKDICLICGGDIYEGRLKLWNPNTNQFEMVAGFECECGRWVRGADGKRYSVRRYADPEHVDTIRQVAELIKGVNVEDARAAYNRIMGTGAQED